MARRKYRSRPAGWAHRRFECVLRVEVAILAIRVVNMDVVEYGMAPGRSAAKVADEAEI